MLLPEQEAELKEDLALYLDNKYRNLLFTTEIKQLVLSEIKGFLNDKMVEGVLPPLGVKSYAKPQLAFKFTKDQILFDWEWKC